MNVVHKNEKIVSVESEEARIYVTHVTIRQSIFFLLLKLLAIEVLAAGGLIIFYSFIISSKLMEAISSTYFSYINLFLILAVILKTALMAFVVVQWLEEYYEITTREVIHKKGLIFKKEERFTLKHLGTIKMQQGMLGKIFHYGTLILYDWVNGKEVYLYLIHNPMKYNKILQHIVPQADKEKQVFREHFVEEENVYE